MEVKAKLNNSRISPRKARLVANFIKGMEIKNARAQLKFLVKRSSDPLAKLLESAIANAKNNFGLDENNLYISKVLVDGGPSLKRWLPRAFGRATPLMKRTSHITLVLNEKVPSVDKKKVKKEKEKVITQEGIIKEATIEQLAKDEEKKVKTKDIKRPVGAGSTSKKRFFSRQTARKIFQRKSI